MAAPGSNDAEMEHRKQLMETWRDKQLEKPRFDDRAIFGPRAGQVILYNVSHIKRSPQPKDPKDPSIIFFGVFNSQEAAVAHAAILQKQHSDIDYGVSSVGKWNMINQDRQTTQIIIEDRIVARLEEDRKRRDHNFDQLKIAQEKRLSSRTGYQKSEREKRRANQPTQYDAQHAAPGTSALPNEDDPAEDAPREPAAGASNFHQHVPQLLMGLTITGQRYMVISVLRDSSKLVRLGKRFPEPLWRVYGAFSNRKKAENYIKHTLAAHIGDYDLDVVEMYDYLHPQNLNPAELVEEFRDPEINNIMNHAKMEQQKSKDFRLQCAAAGKEADMAYIVGKEPVTVEIVTETATEEANVSNVDQGIGPPPSNQSIENAEGMEGTEGREAKSISELISADSADDFASMKQAFLDSVSSLPEPTI